jgi:hypothetical protein
METSELRSSPEEEEEEPLPFICPFRLFRRRKDQPAGSCCDRRAPYAFEHGDKVTWYCWTHYRYMVEHDPNRKDKRLFYHHRYRPLTPQDKPAKGIYMKDLRIIRENLPLEIHLHEKKEPSPPRKKARTEPTQEKEEEEHL